MRNNTINVTVDLDGEKIIVAISERDLRNSVREMNDAQAGQGGLHTYLEAAIYSAAARGTAEVETSQHDRRNEMETMMVERPQIVKDAHLNFLDDLRESGEINMFGAAPYLAEAFGISKKDARTIWAYWAETFTERASQERESHEHAS